MKTLLLKVFLLSFIFSHSQEKILSMASESINVEELKEMLYIYSSDEFGGRGTPSKGQDLAIDFLIDRYKKIGVNPLQKNNYRQEVKLQFDFKPI
ncbi:MAG: hypothetical protein L7T60_06710, partial [Flavobacteriaceae bacterium]|nr:hypothetical protein [Flavobacteriaceae bacterium]